MGTQLKYVHWLRGIFIQVIQFIDKTTYQTLQPSNIIAIVLISSSFCMTFMVSWNFMEFKSHLNFNTAQQHMDPVF